LLAGSLVKSTNVKRQNSKRRLTMQRIELCLVCTILVSSLAIGLSPAARADTLPCAGTIATSTTPCGSSPSSPSIGDPFRVNFNENGQATISMNGGPATTLIGTMIVDPTAPVGSGAMVLAYSLPEPVVSGTVAFGEPGSTAPSDWLRFTNASGVVNGGSTGTGTLMLFYSDVETGDTSPADVGPPPTKAGDNTFACPITSSPICFITEGSTGSTEGNNGFDYRPGGVACVSGNCSNNQYVGISDVTATPEPTSLVLLGSGLVAMGLLVRRRRLSRQG
jgi:hypothetical protein